MIRFNTLLSGILLPAALALCALFFLIYLKGAPFSTFLSDLRGLGASKRSASAPIKGACLALAGTLGVGNMVGVAAAIKEGGAGVLFWMWVSSFAAMVVKYTEIKLSIRHRVAGKEGFEGGAMYYMPHACGVCFALLCLICAFSVGGGMQSSAFCALFAGGRQGAGILFPLAAGVLLCLPLSAVLFMGKGRISDLTAWLVPLMSLLYLFLCLGVLIRYRKALPAAFTQILSSAFRPQSALLGGGAGLLTTLRLGVVRVILSNEAGCGTAPMAHSAYGSEHAGAQGALGAVEVAFDTLFLCTLTGLCLLVYPQCLQADSGMGALLHVFVSVFGRGARPLLAIAIYFFALATLLCWSFYGRRCLSFLFKEKKTDRIFDLLFLLAVLICPFLKEEWVLAVADPTIASMTLLNLFFLFVHRRRLR